MLKIMARDFDNKVYGMVTEEYYTEETAKEKFKKDTGKEIKDVVVLPMTL